MLCSGNQVRSWPRICGAEFVDVNPIALRVENFQDHAVADSHLDAGVEKVARVDDDRLAAALGFEAAEGVDHVVD